ncbi:MAG: nitrate reductase cytochrome c-type subunit [Rhodospirillaceae bacterium]|nr:nitrate reductase cytochrome c-type subunit [Rhodospirillaceae bacterium]
MKQGLHALILFVTAILLLAGCDDHTSAKYPAPSKPVTVTDAGQQIDGIRRGVPINQEATPPLMARVENFDRPRPINYEMQPPTIPHAIDNYQLTVNTNRCMLCHTRSNAEKFQAPPVSDAHYVTRDGEVLEQISTRRYFCVQCHVVQTDAPELVKNTFKGLDTEFWNKAQQ